MKPLLFLTFWSIAVARDPGHSAEYYNVWETRLSDHMFLHGPDVGDEKIPIDQLPKIKDFHNKPMFGAGVPFEHVKIYEDGHAELFSKYGDQYIIPFIAPYYLPYSEVVSGHVWYRETQDQDSLDQAKSQIQTVFINDSITADLESMIVITWQFDGVLPRYPECSPGDINDYNHTQFCNVSCLDNRMVSSPSNNTHLVCECYSRPELLYRYGYESKICVQLRDTPHFIFWKELYPWKAKRTGGLPFSYDKYHACLARGGSEEAARCTARYTYYNRGELDPVSGCDICECDLDDSKPDGYCHCNYDQMYLSLGKLKCFLLSINDHHRCLHLSSCVWFEPISLCRYCDDVRACQNAGSNRPASCDCILPETLTEPHLMRCLLERRYHGDIWLCDDPDLDLDYCKCIQDKKRGDANDQVYCQCYVYTGGRGADFCQCLVDYSYNGTLPDCSGITPLSTCTPDTHGKQQELGTHLNTFQAVILYNGWQTYVYFTYKKLEYIDESVVTKIGYLDGASNFTGYVHPYKERDNLLHFLLFDSNINVPGRWLYKIKNGIQQPEWIPSNKTAYLQAFEWLNQQPW